MCMKRLLTGTFLTLLVLCSALGQDSGATELRYQELVECYLDYYDHSVLDSAEMALVEAIQLMPDAPTNFMLRGNLAELQVARGDTVAAITSLSQAIAEQPTVTQLRSRRAELFEVQGRLNEALIDLDELIKLQPTWEIPLYKRARVREQLGLYGGAIADLEQIIQLNNQAYMPRVALAKVYERQGDSNEAERILTYLINNHAGTPIAYREKSWLLMKQDRKAEALELVREVINELNKATAEDYLIRGTIWLMYGEKSQAEKDYAKAEALGATIEDIENAKARVGL